MPQDPEWWAEARAMVAAGSSRPQVAAHFGKSVRMVQKVCSKDAIRIIEHERKRSRDWYAKQEKKGRQEPAWWAKARDIKKRKPHLSPAAIGRLVKKERTTVLHALRVGEDKEYAERKRANARRAQKLKREREKKREKKREKWRRKWHEQRENRRAREKHNGATRQGLPVYHGPEQERCDILR